MLIDTHIHLDFQGYDSDRDLVVQRSKDAGVEYIINIGAGNGLESTDGAYKNYQAYDCVFPTAGVHPQDASDKIKESDLIERAKRPGIVAIGETGLDFFKDWSPIEEQYKWFKFQIELAKELRLPLIIHSRQAADESFRILKELKASEVGGVFHCYSEDSEFAKKLLDIGFLVSITGTLTFKKADMLREIIRNIPLSQLMLETDGPYMAPEPFRGKRSESAHVLQIAHKMAEIHCVSFEDVCRITTQNAIKLFKLPIENI